MLQNDRNAKWDTLQIFPTEVMSREDHVVEGLRTRSLKFIHLDSKSAPSLPEHVTLFLHQQGDYNNTEGV